MVTPTLRALRSGPFLLIRRTVTRQGDQPVTEFDFAATGGIDSDYNRRAKFTQVVLRMGSLLCRALPWRGPSTFYLHKGNFGYFGNIEGSARF
jgi:hypothetical protein